MNCTAIRLSLAALMLAALGACATSGAGSDRATAKSHPSTGYVVDEERVALVEGIARRRGVLVHWVHKPLKRTRDGG